MVPVSSRTAAPAARRSAEGAGAPPSTGPSPTSTSTVAPPSPAAGTRTTWSAFPPAPRAARRSGASAARSRFGRASTPTTLAGEPSAAVRAGAATPSTSASAATTAGDWDEMTMEVTVGLLGTGTGRSVLAGRGGGRLARGDAAWGPVTPP